jgi:hypothetical protein
VVLLSLQKIFLLLLVNVKLFLHVKGRKRGRVDLVLLLPGANVASFLRDGRSFVVLDSGEVRALLQLIRFKSNDGVITSFNLVTLVVIIASSISIFRVSIKAIHALFHAEKYFVTWGLLRVLLNETVALLGFMESWDIVRFTLEVIKIL